MKIDFSIELNPQNYKLVLQRLSSLFDPQITGGELLITLENNFDDFPISISAPILRDVEGEPITNFTEEFTSTDPDVVQITQVVEGSLRENTIHIGHSGVASINYVVKTPINGEPQIVKSVGKQFTITTGDFATVEGGDLTLPDNVVDV